MTLVPRTIAVAGALGEFASALGAPESHARIIRDGIEYYLIEKAVIWLVNKEGRRAGEIILPMDWENHQAILARQANIKLDPKKPFLLQLHKDWSAGLLTYIREEVMVPGEVVETRVAVEFRRAVYDDPQHLKQAREFLGVGPCAAPPYAPGNLQPDLSFRFGSLPETQFIVREVWCKG